MTSERKRIMRPRAAWIAAGTLLFFLPAVRTQAVDAGASAGMPSAPGKFAVSVRYSTEDRDVYEYDNKENFESTLRSRFVQLAYGLAPHVCVEGRLGQMYWDPQDPHHGVFDYGFAWGLGLRASFPILPSHGISLGWSLAYNHADPDDRTRDDRLVFSGEIEEWQTSADIEKTWKDLMIYTGVRYSQVDLVYRHDSAYGERQGGFEEDNAFGVFFGSEYRFHQKLGLSAEVRLADVTGTTLALSYFF